MLNVKYNLTTSSSYLTDMAAGFNAVSSQKVEVKNNQLVFPETIGKGTFACYEVDTGLSLVILDCMFFEEVNFIRLPAEINYFHSMSFNLTTFSFMVNKHGEEKWHEGESWQNKIYYSTAETGLSWVAPKNIPIKVVVLLLSRDWIINKFHLKFKQSHIPYQKELLEDVPLQFTFDLDLETVLLAQEIISCTPPEFLTKLFYKGYAKRLIALTLDKEADGSSPSETLKYNEVMSIIDAKKNIEDHLELPLPLIDDLAKSCNMSPSKFASMFKAIYAQSYLQFFLELRMEKAAELLKKNWEIVDTAKAVGFVSQSYFAQVFKEYYKIPPKAYRDAATKH